MTEQEAAIDAAWLAWWRRDHALDYHHPPFPECPICQASQTKEITR